MSKWLKELIAELERVNLQKYTSNRAKNMNIKGYQYMESRPGNNLLNFIKRSFTTLTLKLMSTPENLRKLVFITTYIKQLKKT